MFWWLNIEETGDALRVEHRRLGHHEDWFVRRDAVRAFARTTRWKLAYVAAAASMFVFGAFCFYLASKVPFGGDALVFIGVTMLLAMLPVIVLAQQIAIQIHPHGAGPLEIMFPFYRKQQAGEAYATLRTHLSVETPARTQTSEPARPKRQRQKVRDEQAVATKGAARQPAPTEHEAPARASYDEPPGLDRAGVQQAIEQAGMDQADSPTTMANAAPLAQHPLTSNDTGPSATTAAERTLHDTADPTANPFTMPWTSSDDGPTHAAPPSEVKTRPRATQAGNPWFNQASS